MPLCLLVLNSGFISEYIYIIYSARTNACTLVCIYNHSVYQPNKPPPAYTVLLRDRYACLHQFIYKYFIYTRVVKYV